MTVNSNPELDSKLNLCDFKDSVHTPFVTLNDTLSELGGWVFFCANRLANKLNKTESKHLFYLINSKNVFELLFCCGCFTFYQNLTSVI